MSLSDLHKARDKRLLEYMGVEHPYRRPKSLAGKPTRGKILVIADPHCPYVSKRVLGAAESEKDAETLIVPGDVGDYYSKARFRKNRAVSFAEEMRSVFYFFEWAASRWGHVKVMAGNHDNRPEKQVMDIMGKDVDLMILTEQNLMANLAAYFDNIEIVGTRVTGDEMLYSKSHRVFLSHIYQHGDIIFTHGEKSMEQASALMAKISQYLHRWQDVLGLEPFKIIAQGHNHADYRQSVGTEKWIQLPAACEKVSVGSEYIFSSRMIGNTPAMGYGLFYQDKGETDYNSSRNVLI